MIEHTYSAYHNHGVLDHFVGKAIVRADTEKAELELSDGTILVLDKENSDCCSWLDLSLLRGTDNIIVGAEFGDNEDETGGEGEYKAWLKVVTDAGELNVVEADGNASNGYYLHGFALGVTVKVPER